MKNTKIKEVDKGFPCPKCRGGHYMKLEKVTFAGNWKYCMVCSKQPYHILILPEFRRAENGEYSKKELIDIIENRESKFLNVSVKRFFLR